MGDLCQIPALGVQQCAIYRLYNAMTQARHVMVHSKTKLSGFVAVINA